MDFIIWRQSYVLGIAYSHCRPPAIDPSPPPRAVSSVAQIPAALFRCPSLPTFNMGNSSIISVHHMGVGSCSAPQNGPNLIANSLGKTISFQRCSTNLTICMARMFQEKQLHRHNQPPKAPTLHLHLAYRHLRFFSFCTFRSQLCMGPFEFCLPKSISKDQKDQ